MCVALTVASGCLVDRVDLSRDFELVLLTTEEEEEVFIWLHFCSPLRCLSAPQMEEKNGKEEESTPMPCKPYATSIDAAKTVALSSADPGGTRQA
ncbi:hypothetical protein TcWFU_008978 [Taenia crassiceps]|uniref:Uncharacterized protein n=1 Tax=Taenia crassiceps TaxID=6207 RepID=A0ABR4Q288_9CEST